MPTFVYKTMSSGSTATIEAVDRAAAVRDLVRRGETPTSIEPAGIAGAPGRGAIVGGLRGGMSRAEVASLIRELATALQAGLPLVQSLRTLARQGRAGRQREMLETMIEQVEHGKSLADAMQSWGKPFSDLTVSLARAGEVSGRLPEILAQAADLLDRDLKLRRSVVSATLYPMILGVLLVVAIIIVVTVIVPRILEPLKGAAIEMPLPTRIVQGVAHFFGGLWWGVIPGWLVIIPAAALAVWACMRYYASPEGRMKVDMTLLRVPVLGRLLRDVAVARFTRTLGTLTQAGIPVLTSLRVVKATLGNRAMEHVMDDVAEQVAAGRTIADPMERSGYFPPMLVQIVNLGERSGKLDELLSQAAGAFEDRTEQSVKVFTTVLPPLLVVIMAGVVGFVVMAVMLALLAMQDAMRLM
ncbi:MAG: type II secretion system F family protein [Phycisphaerales bacterium]|nr:type II secretion system F family protein [Phycisphaerales bacterium]